MSYNGWANFETWRAFTVVSNKEKIYFAMVNSIGNAPKVKWTEILDAFWEISEK